MTRRGAGRPPKETERDLVWRCLADPQRRRLLELLAEADQGVSDLSRLLELAPATISHHLKILKAAGLAGQRREGRFRDWYLVPAGLGGASRWLDVQRQRRTRPGWNQEAYREQSLARWLEAGSAELPEHPRRRQAVLDWFHSLLEHERLLTGEDLEAAWGAHTADWRPILGELVRQGRLKAQGAYILVSD